MNAQRRTGEIVHEIIANSGRARTLAININGHPVGFPFRYLPALSFTLSRRFP